jgi:hypothetical protein
MAGANADQSEKKVQTKKRRARSGVRNGLPFISSATVRSSKQKVSEKSMFS